MTEDEAKKKWCPQSRVTVDGERILTNMPNDVMRCIGSACMAWNWTTLKTDAPDGHGFCGLARKS